MEAKLAQIREINIYFCFLSTILYSDPSNSNPTHPQFKAKAAIFLFSFISILDAIKGDKGGRGTRREEGTLLIETEKCAPPPSCRERLITCFPFSFSIYFLFGNAASLILTLGTRRMFGKQSVFRQNLFLVRNI